MPRFFVLYIATAVILATALLLPPQTAHAAATIVQKTSNVVTNGSTIVSGFASVTANNLLIVVCSARNSVTLSGPSGFSQAINQSGTPSLAIFYKVATGSETTLSCGLSPSSPGGMQVYEVSGLATSSPLDAVNTTPSTGTSSTPSSGSVTTTTASTFLIAATTLNANTAYSAWSNSFTEQLDFTNGGSNRSTYGGATREVSSAGTYSTTATAGGSAAWRGQIAAFKLAPAGSLSVDIVDAGGSPVSSPSVTLNTTNASLDCQSVTGTLGSSSQKIRATNTTANGNWALTIAPTSGTTALWTNGQTTYDFNDGSGTPAGCGDGGDTDTRAGQLTINASGSTIAPQSGCNALGITKGASSAFSEGSVNSVTLLTASGSQTNCYYDLTNVSLSQKIPGEIPASATAYSLNMTLTITTQ